MENLTGKRPYKYAVSIPGKWSAFIMYLCVNSEKSWEPGLAGSTVAKQLCNALGLYYSKREVINSLGDIEFSRISIAIDYREINELTKLSIHSPENIDCTEYRFLDEENNVRSLNGDSLTHMGDCIWEWRSNFKGYGELMPRECGKIIVADYPIKLEVST